MKRGGKRRHALGQTEPFRTCVGTRTSGPARELLRFVRAPDGTLGFDVTASLPHRGAWTLPNRDAIARAVDRGAFARAFEAPVLASSDGLVAEVERVLEGEVLRAIGLLRRQSGLICGRTEVREALAAGRRGQLLLAHDLAERSRQEFMDHDQNAATLPALPAPAMAELGSALGRAPCGVLLFTDHGRLGQRLTRDLTRLARLRGQLAPAPAAVSNEVKNTSSDGHGQEVHV